MGLVNRLFFTYAWRCLPLNYRVDPRRCFFIWVCKKASISLAIKRLTLIVRAKQGVKNLICKKRLIIFVSYFMF